MKENEAPEKIYLTFGCDTSKLVKNFKAYMKVD